MGSIKSVQGFIAISISRQVYAVADRDFALVDLILRVF